MSVAYENLMEYLGQRELKHQALQDRAAALFPMTTKVAVYQLVAQVDDDLFQMIGFVSPRAPEGARRDLAEAIARANYNLKVGKFELDFSDGEIRFQASTILEGDHLPDILITRMIAVVLAMLDRYLPAFLSVIYGNELPSEAIRQAEADIHRPRGEDRPTDESAPGDPPDGPDDLA